VGIVRFRSVAPRVHMMIRFSRVFLALILCGAFTEPVLAQSTPHVLDAPFTATVIANPVGQAPIKMMRIARASNGSTYRGPYDRDRKDGYVVIDDVPNHRRIEYRVVPPQFRDHSYRLTTKKFFTESVEQHRARLGCCIPDKDKVKGGRLYHYTPLGEKNDDGMILFGRRVEETLEDGTKRVSEYWDSDLGVEVSRTVDGPQPGRHESWIVTDIRREEPDPSLFQVPKEYLSDPLLEAKTIFIDNQTGITEVLDMTTGQLNSGVPRRHKPLTTVPEKNAADLTVIFTKISDTELEATNQAVKILNRTPASGIKMQIYLRGSSEPEFVTAAGSSGSAKGDVYAAQLCVNGLQNLMENARVGQWPPADASKRKDSLTHH
jgi:hypothetical protein